MERDDDPENKDAHSDGAATDWFTASAPVEPGEDMLLELVVWDAGDHWFDTRRAARRLRVADRTRRQAGATQ